MVTYGGTLYALQHDEIRKDTRKCVAGKKENRKSC